MICFTNEADKSNFDPIMMYNLALTGSRDLD
jgi:hypothetical protein